MKSKILLGFLVALLCVLSVSAQQTSPPVVFTVSDPVLTPSITTTTPSQTSAGSPQFTLTVNGANFQSNSVVQWTPSAAGSATTALVTTFVSSTKLTAVVPASLVTTKSTVNITVLNPIIQSQHNVGLSWQYASQGTGGITFSLYRGTTPGGPYSKIASGITTTAATDATVKNNTTYYYVCTAVDASGNESAFSNEASAVIPA